MRELDPEHVAQLGKNLSGLREFALFQFTRGEGYFPGNDPFPARSYDEMQELVRIAIELLDHFIIDYQIFSDFYLYELSWVGPPPLYTWYYTALVWRHLIAGTPYPDPPWAGQVVNVRVLPKKWH